MGCRNIPGNGFKQMASLAPLVEEAGSENTELWLIQLPTYEVIDLLWHLSYLILFWGTDSSLLVFIAVPVMLFGSQLVLLSGACCCLLFVLLLASGE